MSTNACYLRLQSMGAGEIIWIDAIELHEIGNPTDNFAYLPSTDFTSLDDGSKYTLQFQTKSVGIESANLVTDGGFDGTCGVEWTCGSGWSIASSKAVGNASGTSITQSLSLASGTYFTYSFTISDYTSGQVRLEWAGGNSGYKTANGTYTGTVQLSATNSTVYFYAYSVGDNFVGKIDDFSIKEITPPDLTVQIGSSFETFENISPLETETKVWNFEYDSTGYMKQLVNGTFDDATGWNIGDGHWTIANGKAWYHADANGYSCTQYGVFTAGEYCNIQFEISGVAEDSLAGILFWGTDHTTTGYGNGVHNVIVKNTATQFSIQGYNTSNYGSFYIDNIFIEKIPEIQLYVNQPDIVYIDEFDLSQANDLTILAWVYPTEASGYRSVFSHSTGWYTGDDVGYECYLGMSWGKVALRINNGYTQGVEDIVPTNTWSCIAWRINRTDSAKIFVNGVADGILNMTTYGVLRNDSPVRIGQHASSTNRFIGYIGEVQAIYGLLTDEEILQAKNLGKSGKHYISTYTNGTVMSWYKWAGSTNEEMLVDEMGNNNMTGYNITIEDQVKIKGGYK